MATSRLLLGKRKARITSAGNRVEASLNEQDCDGAEDGGQSASAYGTKAKGFEHYASGTDGDSGEISPEEGKSLRLVWSNYGCPYSLFTGAKKKQEWREAHRDSSYVHHGYWWKRV